mgnify:CR=1 FL=1
MNKKLIIGIVIIVVIILSQWLGVKMIYSGKLDGQVAHLMSKVYHLKAGTIEKDDDKSQAGDCKLSLDGNGSLTRDPNC